MERKREGRWERESTKGKQGDTETGREGAREKERGKEEDRHGKGEAVKEVGGGRDRWGVRAGMSEGEERDRKRRKDRERKDRK